MLTDPMGYLKYVLKFLILLCLEDYFFLQSHNFFTHLKRKILEFFKFMANPDKKASDIPTGVFKAVLHWANIRTLDI